VPNRLPAPVPCRSVVLGRQPSQYPVSKSPKMAHGKSKIAAGTCLSGKTEMLSGTGETSICQFSKPGGHCYPSCSRRSCSVFVKGRGCRAYPLFDCLAGLTEGRNLPIACSFPRKAAEIYWRDHAAFDPSPVPLPCKPHGSGSTWFRHSG